MIDRGLQVAGEAKRSEHWPKVEKDFKEAHPECAACGMRGELNVHHIFPFHEIIAAGRPDLELDPRNLITLCVNPEYDCHCEIGHLGNFSSYNVRVLEDCKKYGKLKKVEIEANPDWLLERNVRPSGHFNGALDRGIFLSKIIQVFGKDPQVDLHGDVLGK